MATHDEEDQVGEIEKIQLPNTSHDQSHTITITDPATQNPTATDNVENNNGNKTDTKTAESVVNNASTTTTASTTTSASNSSTWLPNYLQICVMAVIITIFIILIFPFFLVFLIGLFIFGDVRTLLLKRPKPKDIYTEMLQFESTRQKLKHFSVLTVTKAGCLALLWLVVNLCVPSLKIVTLFQCPLWKWALLAVVIFLGYPVTLMMIAIILFPIKHAKCSGESKLVYFLNGLEDSLISVFHSAAILVMWLCYFRTDRGLHPSERVDKFGTCTFVSLLVGAILWVLKCAILLKWQDNAVLKKMKDRIITVGFQLYFLARMEGNERDSLRHLLPWWSDYREYKSKKDQKKDKSIQEFMLSTPVSVNKIDKVAECIKTLALLTNREKEVITEVIDKFKQKIPEETAQEDITEKTLKEKFKLDKDEAQLLLQELEEKNIPTYATFKKWVVDAHQKYFPLGYTLSDAFKVVRALDWVMMGFIIVVVILLWLNITELATTKVVVLVASPFLALSFMFQDSCKTFSQGIIFSFVAHPYDVGDRCIIEGIEGIELEVKTIDVLITTFYKIGTKEVVICPNASLATKLITNLKGEPDPSDKIELNLDSSTTKEKIERLKCDLESYFHHLDQEKFCDKNIQVAVKEIRSSIKVRKLL